MRAVGSTVLRTLAPSPSSFLDARTGAPAIGSYEGPLPRIDVSKHLIDRAFRRKKWLYVGLASSEVWVSLAIVRMGYATSAFAFVLDLDSHKMLADETIVGPPRAASIVDDVHGAGVLARFGFGKASLSIERRGPTMELRARFGALAIDAALDESRSPPPISAIAELGAPGLISATEKRVLTTVRGSITTATQRIVLDESTGAVGGYDYTHGLMPRHTQWRWAYAMGHAKDGQPIAFNLTSGFVGEAECAAFRASSIHPLCEPRFVFDVDHPERPWKLTGDGIDLTFEVGAVHAQNTNLVLVRSKFLQPGGRFRGTIRIDGKDVEIDGVPGVVEDQDVLW